VEVEIDEEANEVKKRKIIGLMKKDQVIDIFREAEINVGKTKKRMYENITHAQRLNYKMNKNNFYFQI
jgi:hypothetical protein